MEEKYSMRLLCSNRFQDNYFVDCRDLEWGKNSMLVWCNKIDLQCSPFISHLNITQIISHLIITQIISHLIITQILIKNSCIVALKF